VKRECGMGEAEGHEEGREGQGGRDEPAARERSVRECNIESDRAREVILGK
jgi:hypothetical protein